ncbi:hypothetical protein ACE6ED_15720 [Paenibacillus sp. CN-4]|uniref:hypothetical protein n=1 Tax=Paenibacillus nanchangensis TaxID=3348343 RepID=UPI003978C562
MTDEQLLRVAVTVASLQTLTAVLGLMKALFEWQTARQKAKGPTRRKRVKPSAKKRHRKG